MRTSGPGAFLLLVVLVASASAEPVRIEPHDLTLQNDLTITLNSSSLGTTPLFTVTGTVTLGGGLILNATGAPFPLGRTYLIIENDGTDPVVGTFTGLPQGAFLESGGQVFTISYTGGTGNDVVLRAVAGATVPALDPVALVAMTLLLAGAALFVMKR